MAIYPVVMGNGGGNAKKPVIEAKTITENGTYTAGDAIDGFSPITVNVPSSKIRFLGAGTSFDLRNVTENWNKLTINHFFLGTGGATNGWIQMYTQCSISVVTILSMSYSGGILSVKIQVTQGQGSTRFGSDTSSNTQWKPLVYFVDDPDFVLPA